MDKKGLDYKFFYIQNQEFYGSGHLNFSGFWAYKTKTLIFKKF
jgi:hypothetical protein